MIYLQLFLSFLQVGMFSIGGGYAAIPLIRDQIVTSHTWLTMNEFTDLITIAEMTPGPIAVSYTHLRPESHSAYSGYPIPHPGAASRNGECWYSPCFADPSPWQ